MANDPITDLELLADDNFLALDNDMLGKFGPWDPPYDNQRMQAEEAKLFEEQMPIAFSGTSASSSAGMPPNFNTNVLLQDYFSPVDLQAGAPTYFHPGVPSSVNSSGNEFPPSVATFGVNEEPPGSVKPLKSRDRARHREVEQKYRNRINSKMDELCALLTPDGKPQMQKFTALDNAIKLIKYLRRQNDFFRTESANLRAQVYTLQCALNRSMGVDFVPNTAFPPDQQLWMSDIKLQPGSVSPRSTESDDIPVQRARVALPSPPSTSPASYSDESHQGGVSTSSSSNSSRVSPTFFSQQPPMMPPTQQQPASRKMVPVGRPAPTATTAAIPQGKTVLACVLFSVLFFWNPFVVVSQHNDDMHSHHGHDHSKDRVLLGSLDSGSQSWFSAFQWLTSTYIIAGVIHLLLFGWLMARLFILPEEMMSSSDIETDVKNHVRRGHDDIANGHYAAAFEELSAACALMGHPLPHTTLDVALAFIWAVCRQIGHIFRTGIAITVWTVQFLADGPLQPTVLHRRLTTCASIQQRIVKLAAAGKIELPACTRLSLALSSISLQETAYALATSSCDRHWHQLLEDSYITAGILILQFPLPMCFFARYYFFQAKASAKLFGSVGEHRRFGWLYSLESSVLKDLVAMSCQAETKQDLLSQSVFFENKSPKGLAIQEPWSRIAWLRSRDLLTELLSCLTLSIPASSPTSIPKALRCRSVDAIAEHCLSELEQIENCLRGGISTSSRLGAWLKLFRGSQAWRRADLAALQPTKKNDESSSQTFEALQFALAAASLLPNASTRHDTIQRLLRASSAILENNVHDNPDDIVLQFCRLMAAEIVVSCRLHLVGRCATISSDKRSDLCQAEASMTVYLLMLDRMSPNHPRALMYRSRVALAAGENPAVAERFAKAALAVSVDSNQNQARYHSSSSPCHLNLLSAEAILLLSLIRSKYNKLDSSSNDREALLQAVSSFNHENSPSLAYLCNQLVGVE